MILEFDAPSHTYRINGIPVLSVTQALTGAGIIDPRWYTEEARARGSAVHAACWYIDEGDLDRSTLHPSLDGYVRAYENFKQDTGFKPTLIEKQVGNEAFFYAGTLDRLGEFPEGGLITPFEGKDLIDLKSGAVEPWARIQTAAYGACFGVRPRRWALQLKNDGTYKLHGPWTDPMDFHVFTGALAVANWKRNNGGGKYGIESCSAD